MPGGPSAEEQFDGAMEDHQDHHRANQQQGRGRKGREPGGEQGGDDNVEHKDEGGDNGQGACAEDPRRNGKYEYPGHVELSASRLWDAHVAVLARLHAGDAPLADAGEATVLDLKIELARRILSSCTLCAQRCRVNRLAGEVGICRLGVEAHVAEHFVHIGEEPSVNPSLLISLAGCGLRCRYCQQASILNPAKVCGEPLEPSLWTALDARGARSLSFAGGNPDESIHSVLRFLVGAPSDWPLFIVWNCHGAATGETLALLDGVVDAWLPDYKYGNNACGRRLSGIDGCADAASRSTQAMLSQNVPVIVRLLVLPCHLDRCHLPVLKDLARLSNGRDLWISIRGQYCPDWRISRRDGAMMRRPQPYEVAAVRGHAEALGLKLVPE